MDGDQCAVWQERAQKKLESFFEHWGNLITKCHIHILIFSLVCFGWASMIYIDAPQANYAYYVWTPSNNQSRDDLLLTRDTYGPVLKYWLNGYDTFKVAFESKEEGKLLTLEAFKDMINFEERLQAIEFEGQTWSESCLKYKDIETNEKVSF